MKAPSEAHTNVVNYDILQALICQAKPEIFMSRTARVFLGVLVGFMASCVVAFIVLVGFYTVKIRRGDTITGVTTTSGFTRSSSLPRTTAISTELIAKIADTDGDPTFGEPTAPIQIIEFADAQCPYSAAFSQTLRKAMLAYPDKFHFVFKDFPLNDIHPNATRAALALSCANKQNRFWQMHDKVFGSQDKLSATDLQAYANQIGLNVNAFQLCLIDPTTKKEVATDTTVGTEAGVAGTPTFFINGNKVEGAIPSDLFEKLLTNSK